MADFDAPGATAHLNINDLPNEIQTAIFRQVANQPDRAAAFCELNALRSTDLRFQAIIDADPIIGFATLLQETEGDRHRNAENEARSPKSSRTASEIITYYGVTNPYIRHDIKQLAARRDIKAKVVAPLALDRNEVDNPYVRDAVKQQAALQDIRDGMDFESALDRHEVDPRHRDYIKQLAAPPKLVRVYRTGYRDRRGRGR